MEPTDKAKAIQNFDPSGMANINGNIYGLPFSIDDARLVILPVPWEVTVSYQAGTANAPEAILEASYQVDLYDPLVKDAWKLGVAMLDVPSELKEKSNMFRLKAEEYLTKLSHGQLNSNEEGGNVLNEINQACSEMNSWVKEQSLNLLEQNKLVALLGGDHSTPLGLMQALAQKHEDFGILHLDAHADLRKAYEGFQFSHASIMYNALSISQVKKLVQVGIRDYCEDEAQRIASDQRIQTFFDRDIQHKQFEGIGWSQIADDIIATLPSKVYVSFDIDGLDPTLCPNTGTPVPGGLGYEQAIYLIEKVVKSGREIIGFDLNEVAPGQDEWDANVAARILYRLANLCIVSMETSK